MRSYGQFGEFFEITETAIAPWFGLRSTRYFGSRPFLGARIFFFAGLAFLGALVTRCARLAFPKSKVLTARYARWTALKIWEKLFFFRQRKYEYFV
jgi:hypothetical protein